MNDSPWRETAAHNEFTAIVGRGLSPVPMIVVVSATGQALIRTPEDVVVDPWDVALTLHELSNVAMVRARALS